MTGLANSIKGCRRLDKIENLKLPAGWVFDKLLIGADGQEALSVNTPVVPTAEALRGIHRQRLGKRNVPLAVVAVNGESAWLLGPSSEATPAGPLPKEQAARILRAVLEEPSAIASRQRLIALINSAADSAALPGITNSGLFATYYLEKSVPQRLDWKPSGAQAQPLLSLRGPDLIKSLGYRSEDLGSGAMLLTAGDGPAQAVAVFIEKTECFDGSTRRFGASPVAYGLKWAQQRRVPWVVITRGAEIRLYPARPDVGVGRRSQAETYFAVDMTVVDEHTAAFLPLVFGAEALAEGGTVAEILAQSERFAADLGMRLRERVYKEVVPSLAVAVGDEFQRLGLGDDLNAAYRITLKILFRLLFQAYAEDQELLPYRRNERYRRNSLSTQANDFVERSDRPLDSDSHSIWDDLQQVWSVIDVGDADWDVPAYDGGLFGQDPVLHPDGHLISQMKLPNSVVGGVLRHLLIDTQNGVAGPVDFRSLSVREFGTIYEGLLESSLSRADQDLTVDKKGAYLPAKPGDQVVTAAGEVYYHNASGERKATGSYFTPSFAVEHLLERALDPTLDRHLAEVAALLEGGSETAAAEKLFDFRVADLAMGSGHFLVAAIDRIEAKMAAFLVDHPIPRVNAELDKLEAAARLALGSVADEYAIEHSALLRRQIARRCIYGLDINEIAVELARVAVWIHTFVPGLPMSNLDHNLVCANSLTGIGTIEEAAQALEPRRPAHQPSFVTAEIETKLEEARRLLTDAANSLEATTAEVRATAKASEAARATAEPVRQLLDAAVAARCGWFDPGTCADVAGLVKASTEPHVQNQLSPLHPGHFPFLFPEAFGRADPGFDVLVGNPPWEKLQVERHAFWSLRFPGIRGLPAAAREQRVRELVDARPDLVRLLKENVEASSAIRSAVVAGPYPGIGAGHVDLYKAFAWRNWHLMRSNGSAGIVLPRSALFGDGTTEWRKSILTNGTFADVCLLTNTGNWAFDMEARYTISLTVFHRGAEDVVRFSGPFHSEADFVDGRDRPTTVPRQEFETWSDSLSFPMVPDSHAGEIIRKMKRHPRLDDDAGFEPRPVQGDINATSDRDRFDTDLFKTDLDMPVLTGGSFNLWDPDFGAPYGRADSRTLLPHLFEKARRGARNSSSAFHGLGIASIEDHPSQKARMAFRDITNSTNTRTAIFCLLPPKVALVHMAPYLVRRSGAETDEAYLLGVVSSIPLDWYARRWVETHLTFSLLNPMPVPRPDPNNFLRRRVVDLAGRLAAVDARFQAWADAVGVPVGTLRSEPERSDAICELDALAALLYGLDWDDVTHIFETFHRGWDYAERLSSVKTHFENWRSQA